MGELNNPLLTCVVLPSSSLSIWKTVSPSTRLLVGNTRAESGLWPAPPTLPALAEGGGADGQHSARPAQPLSHALVQQDVSKPQTNAQHSTSSHPGVPLAPKQSPEPAIPQAKMVVAQAVTSIAVSASPPPGAQGSGMQPATVGSVVRKKTPHAAH